MGTIVSVLGTPICNNLAGFRHVGDDLLWGGTEVWGPAVYEGYFDEPSNFCHDPLEIFERVVIDDCSKTGGIEQSGDVRGQFRAPYNKDFV